MHQTPHVAAPASGGGEKAEEIWDCMMAALANKVDTSLLLQSAEGDEGCLIENFMLTLWRKSIVTM